MTKPSRPIRSAFLAYIVAILAFLAFQIGVQQHPNILGDEYQYLALALNPPGMVEDHSQPIPNSFVFTKLYSLVGQCGDSYLFCGRYINLVFFALTLMFVYRFVVAVLGTTPLALLVFIGTSLPLSMYINVYMPETLYTAVFFFLVEVQFDKSLRLNRAARHTITAVACGVLMFVKPHGVAVLAGFLAFYGLVEMPTWRWANLRKSLALLMLMIAGLAVTVYALRHLSGADKVGLGAYSGLAGRNSVLNAVVLQPLILLKFLVAHTFFIVLGTAGLLLAAPLLWFRLAKANGSPTRWVAENPLWVFTLLQLAAIVTMVAAYATLMNVGGLTNWRLHGRYLYYIYPLVVTTAVSAISGYLDGPWKKSRWLTGISIALGVLLFWYWARVAGKFRLLTPDYPSLQWAVERPGAHWLIAAMIVGAFVLWNWPRAGIWLTVGCFMAGAIWSQVIVFRYYQIQPNPYDKAGSFLRYAFTPQQRSQGLVLSAYPGGAMRVAFYLTPSRTRYEVSEVPIDVAQKYDLQQIRWVACIQVTCSLPDSVWKWANVRGTEVFIPNFRKGEVWATNSRPMEIRFGREGTPIESDGFYPQAEGMVSSSAPTATMYLPLALDGRTAVAMQVRGFGTNAGKMLRVTIGNESKSVVLPAEPEVRTLRFNVSPATNKVVFSGIEPIAAASLGVSSDAPPLGFGLHNVTITREQ